MRHVLRKSLIALFCLTLAFAPALPTTKKAQAFDFSEFGGEIASTALGCFGVLDKIASSLSSLTDSLVGSVAQSVPVDDSEANSKEGCLDAIAYTAAKIVLAKITKSTLTWINSGFEGSPTFVQNPGSFFESIANEEVSSFTAQIAFDPERYPFGRLTAQNIINSIQNQLDYNATVSSRNLLNFDNNPNIPYAVRFENFTQDFLYGGGWDGYLAITQISSANPYDSYIQSINQIGSVVNSAENQQNPIDVITQELQQSGGFLTLKKCVNPLDYEDETEDVTYTRGEAQSAANQGDPAAQDWLRRHTCIDEQAQTPGSAIAEQMKISLGQTQEQLTLADELNESITAVFDALLSQLFSKGVQSLSGEDDASSNVSVLGGYGNNTGSSTISTNPGGGSTGSTQWYNQNQNFNLKEAIAPGGVINDADCHFTLDITGTEITNPDAITSIDCNQGYAVIQKVYAEALVAQNIKLEEAIRWIGSADYCLPGPRPDWYQSAITAVSGLQERFAEIAQEEDEEDRADHSYAELKYFTGFAAKYDDTVNLRNAGNAYNAIYQTLSEKIGGWGYRQYIEDRYGAFVPDMPPISSLINQEYGKKNHYQNVLEKNQVAIAEAESMFLRLSNIYENIRVAEIDFNVGTPTEDTANFNKFMDNQLKVFSRLVSQIKTTSSVTNVIADIALAEDEIKYISDPVTGLFEECRKWTVDTRPLPTATMTRRAYKEPKATPSDFAKRGWPTTRSGFTVQQSFVQNPSQTFLPGITISAVNQGSTYIYIGHYVNQCSQIPLNGSVMYQPAGPCYDGDQTLRSSTGDRFEEHINAY
jgi:hypothetical protein